MKVVIMHFSDRKRPSLVLECGNQGIVLGSFRNDEMGRLFKYALGGNRGIDLCSRDEWTLDEVLEDFKNADSN